MTTLRARQVAAVSASDVAPDELARLVSSRRRQAAAQAASHPLLPEPAMRRAADKALSRGDQALLTALAANPSAPAEMLTRIVGRGGATCVFETVRNPNASSLTLLAAYRRASRLKESEIRTKIVASVAMHAECDDSVVRLMLETGTGMSVRIVKMLLHRENLDGATVTELERQRQICKHQMDARAIGLLAAQHPSAAVGLVTSLAMDEDMQVARTAAARLRSMRQAAAASA